MDIQKWWQNAIVFAQENQTMIEIIVFALGFAESIVFVSLFVPSTLLFVGIAALEGAAGGSLLPLLLAGAAGAFLGDMVSYTIGGRFKYTLPAFWPFRTNPHWFSGAQALFAKWGASAVIVSKFTGPLRAVVPVAAGAMHMPARSFMTASSVSCLLWSGALLTPGYYGLRLIT